MGGLFYNRKRIKGMNINGKKIRKQESNIGTELWGTFKIGRRKITFVLHFCSELYI